MSNADIHFYFDPVCPFAWMTSKWVRIVQAQRAYGVDWRFISLRLINATVDYDRHFPVGYEAGHTAGLRLLRVAARTRAEHGRAWIGPLYAAIGARVFDTAAEPDRADGGYRGTRTFLEPILSEAGLPAELADALDDTSFDAELRRETDEALALTGKDVGTPIIHFQSPDGVGFFARWSAACPARPRPSRCGTTSSAWPVFRASPSSNAACPSGRSYAASAWNLAGSASRRTGTPAAGTPRDSGA